MAISLQKGGNVNLSQSDPNLNQVLVGLGWSSRTSDGIEFDLDASLFMVGENSKVRNDRDFIFYNQLKSMCGSVEHTGDNKTGDGDGDDESLKIVLNLVPTEIKRLIIGVTIHDAIQRKQNFGMVQDAYIRILNSETSSEITRFDLSEDYSIETAMVFGEIYRYNGEWKFKAVGQGFSGGLNAMAVQHGVNVM